MHIFSSIMFALSANIDTLIVGISYGIKKSRIPFVENVIISLITFAGTFLAIWMGMQITVFIPAKAAQIFGSMILLLLGIYYSVMFVIKTIQGKYKTEHWDNEDTQTRNITLKEVFILSFALSVNNMGMGIGASIAGMQLIPTSVCTLLFCMLFLYVGNKIGNVGVSEIMQKYSEPVSGLILIILGLYEFLH